MKPKEKQQKERKKYLLYHAVGPEDYLNSHRGPPYPVPDLEGWFFDDLMFPVKQLGMMRAKTIGEMGTLTHATLVKLMETVAQVKICELCENKGKYVC